MPPPACATLRAVKGISECLSESLIMTEEMERYWFILKSKQKLLKRKKKPTYVHTINDYQKAEKYIKKFEITEIYTDFLAP